MLISCYELFILNTMVPYIFKNFYIHFIHIFYASLIVLAVKIYFSAANSTNSTTNNGTGTAYRFYIIELEIISFIELVPKFPKTFSGTFFKSNFLEICETL